jgi:hypothetical protein
MSENIIIAAISSIPPTLMAALAWWKVRGVHKELNSRLSQWRSDTATATIASNAAARAEGIKEEKDKNGAD